MAEQIDLSPQLHYSSLDAQNELPHAEGAAIPLAADRLYQFAALTAGLFLLFTLL
ncbi:hypothetical protein [Granulicella sp. S190]|uniref:hypothetical protein n=1 Tax=Granulicella sp. S190 TaxID=1747226 RepID=UPI00131C8E19|nr:hypothetical protein [Granulicella sp. S190]